MADVERDIAHLGLVRAEVRSELRAEWRADRHLQGGLICGLIGGRITGPIVGLIFGLICGLIILVGVGLGCWSESPLKNGVSERIDRWADHGLSLLG